MKLAKIRNNRNMRSLAQFTSLESITIKEPLESSTDLALLGPLMQLKELNVFNLRLTKAVAQWLGSLPNLRSLCYSQLVREDVDRGVSEESASEDFFNYLKQLSSLSFKGQETGNSIAMLDLVDLRVDITYAFSWAQVLDFTQVLRHQTNLERLDLYCGGLYVPSAALSNLKRLRSLMLRCVYVDKDVFLTLGSFQELTCLHFSVLNLRTPGREINLMTRLHSLTLGCLLHSFDVACVKLVREGCFPSLKYLYLLAWRLDKEEEEKLRMDRPCLRILDAQPE